MEWFWGLVILVAWGLAWQFRRMRIQRKAFEPGQLAPEFELVDQHGQTHRLEDYQGKWLVLYFYPKDDTPGCTRQACGFRDDLNQIKALDAEVLGVSVDTTSSHKDFADKFSLPFSLLADTAADTAARYCSLFNFGIVKCAQRNTFLIDPHSRIAKIYWSASAARNSDQIVTDLKSLQDSEPVHS